MGILLSVLLAVSATPTMGWSSWNTYRVNISDSIICRQADEMVRLGLKDAGYKYINIDDGYFGGRDGNGKLTTHPVRFPNGLKPTVDHIHSLGLKAGIYSDAGVNTCGNFWDKDELGNGVGFYGHDEEDARYFFIENGFDFIKIDFCGGQARQNDMNLDLDERDRYTAIREAIDATGNDSARINICRWAFPGTWVRSVGDSWRISPDIAPRWSSIKNIINRNRFLSAYAGPGHFNDMDMLEIGRGLSEAEERTHFGMWCMLSSPLLIGCDLTSIPPTSLSLISNPELIAINQDALGLQAVPVREDNGVTIWVKDLKQPHSTTRAVALSNLSDSTSHVSFSFEEDALLTGNVAVRDAFERRDSGRYMDHMEVTVDPHDTRIFILQGEGRLEQTAYEAESAWLEAFDDLGFNPWQARALNDGYCSGGGKVCGLDNTPGNWMEWRDVYSRNGGDYQVEIVFSDNPCCLLLTVNGKITEYKGNATHVISLAQGSNRIRIENKSTDAKPEIDCLRLKKIR